MMEREICMGVNTDRESRADCQKQGKRNKEGRTTHLLE